MTIYKSDAGVIISNAKIILLKNDKEVGSMKKRSLKGNNKGFTLVELIVVLVILAILAAILVPALLGYIDSARNKQTLLNARSAMTAAQAELSAIYGTKATLPKEIEKNGTHNANLLATMDQPSLSCNTLVIGCKAVYQEDTDTYPRNKQHDAFTVNYVEYVDGTGAAYYIDGEWLDTAPEEKPACAVTYYTVIGTGKYTTN